MSEVEVVTSVHMAICMKGLAHTGTNRLSEDPANSTDAKHFVPTNETSKRMSERAH